MGSGNATYFAGNPRSRRQILTNFFWWASSNHSISLLTQISIWIQEYFLTESLPFHDRASCKIFASNFLNYNAWEMSCIGGALHYLSAVVFDVCRTGGMSAVFGSEDSMVNIETWRAVHILRGHTGGQYWLLSVPLLQSIFFNGTEWPYVFWSAVKKLLTHYSLFLLLLL